jgi:hypothetical protein
MARDSADLRDETLPPLYALRLEDLHSWHVLIGRCEHCQHEGEVYPDALRKRWPPHTRVLHLKDRLRCTACGNREFNYVSVRRLPR